MRKVEVLPTQDCEAGYGTVSSNHQMGVYFWLVWPVGSVALTKMHIQKVTE